MARIRTMGVVSVAAVAVIGVFATRGSAQAPPTITLPGLTTTTAPPTTAPGSSPTTGPADPNAPGDSSTTTTIDVSQDGDAGSAVGGGPGQIVPPDAQAIIDALVRTGAKDNHLLVAVEKALLAAGVDPDQAARLAYGRFP